MFGSLGSATLNPNDPDVHEVLIMFLRYEGADNGLRERIERMIVHRLERVRGSSDPCTVHANGAAMSY